MIKKIFAAAALTLLASSSFAAAPNAFYGGVDLGLTNVDGMDNSKTSIGGFVGYSFNRFIAGEVGYRQLGKWNYYGADFTLSQTQVSAVGSFPLNPQLDIYGRLGYNNLTGSATSGGYRYSADSSGGLIGVGLHYSFTPGVSARIEVQKPASDVTNYNIGVVFKF